MKKLSLAEDKFAYRNIIITDIFIILIALAITILLGEPIALLLALPFAYDFYHVAFYKERTPVSIVSEVIGLIP